MGAFKLKCHRKVQKTIDQEDEKTIPRTRKVTDVDIPQYLSTG